MDKQRWHYGYRLVRLFMGGKLSEETYWRGLARAGFTSQQSIWFMRVYSWRSDLYGQDTTLKARLRIDKRMWDWRMSHLEEAL